MMIGMITGLLSIKKIHIKIVREGGVADSRLYIVHVEHWESEAATLLQCLFHSRRNLLSFLD